MTTKKEYTAETAEDIAYDPTNFASQMRFITANLLYRKPLDMDGQKALLQVQPIAQKLRRKIEKVYGVQKNPNTAFTLNQIAEYAIQRIVFDHRPVDEFLKPSNKSLLMEVRKWVKKGLESQNEQK